MELYVVLIHYATVSVKQATLKTDFKKPVNKNPNLEALCRVLKIEVVNIVYCCGKNY